MPNIQKFDGLNGQQEYGISGYIFISTSYPRIEPDTNVKRRVVRLAQATSDANVGGDNSLVFWYNPYQKTFGFDTYNSATVFLTAFTSTYDTSDGKNNANDHWVFFYMAYSGIKS